jgi:imidazolonepropionase
MGAELRELAIIENGALLASDGVIEAIGRSEEIEPLIASDATLIDAHGRILLPGFVDAHTHLVFGGNRADEFEARAAGKSYEDIAEAGGGILSTVQKTRKATLEQLVEIGKKHLQWMVHSGTTTIEAKSGYGLSIEEEIKILLAYRRLNSDGPVEIVATLLAPHAIPPEYKGSPTGYVQEVAIPLLKRAKDESLADFADAFVEAGYFNESTLEPYFREAARLGFPLRLHVDQLQNSGGAQLAAKLGAKTADHLEQSGELGVRALERSGVQPVLLPASVFGLGKTKYPDARLMIDCGLPVVLATDFNPGSSPCPSMPMVMSLACSQMKMTAAEALTACTVNAAYSLNRGHDRGSLDLGKRADFVIHDAEDFREIPYWLGRQTAWKVFIQGRVIL